MRHRERKKEEKSSALTHTGRRKSLISGLGRAGSSAPKQIELNLNIYYTWGISWLRVFWTGMIWSGMLKWWYRHSPFSFQSFSVVVRTVSYSGFSSYSIFTPSFFNRENSKKTGFTIQNDWIKKKMNQTIVLSSSLKNSLFVNRLDSIFIETKENWNIHTRQMTHTHTKTRSTESIARPNHEHFYVFNASISQ